MQKKTPFKNYAPYPRLIVRPSYIGDPLHSVQFINVIVNKVVIIIDNSRRINLGEHLMVEKDCMFSLKLRF